MMDAVDSEILKAAVIEQQQEPELKSVSAIDEEVECPAEQSQSEVPIEPSRSELTELVASKASLSNRDDNNETSSMGKEDATVSAIDEEEECPAEQSQSEVPIEMSSSELAELVASKASLSDCDDNSETSSMGKEDETEDGSPPVDAARPHTEMLCEVGQSQTVGPCEVPLEMTHFVQPEMDHEFELVLELGLSDGVFNSISMSSYFIKN
jgi:hypothetical protein